ncbi:MAG: hypothetical protein AAB932_00470 [Patescibacteria group bacterium]
MDNNSRIEEIFEVVTFIKDNAVTKGEFDELKKEVVGLQRETGGLKVEVGGLGRTVDELKADVGELKQDVAVIKQDVAVIKQDIVVIKQDIVVIKQDIAVIQSTMVTKDHLDEKMSDLRGDLVVLARKEDTKVKALINLLKAKQVITEGDAKQLLTMEPFAELAL